MKQFSGFPARMDFTPLPNLFFSSLVPQINDPAELITTLYIFWELYRKRGHPRFVTYRELASNKSLIASLKGLAAPVDEVLCQSLEKAAQRGTILHLILDSEAVYFLNTESNRQAITRIKNGELHLSGLTIKEPAPTNTEEPPDIFTLYEQNVGMLTPIIADELREAEKLYPETWIRDAIKEAVQLNKRSWRYIARILDNWQSEGKSDGAYQRDSAKTGPEKYFTGKYGHMVKR